MKRLDNFDDVLLIDKFNEREDVAFSEVYVYVYKELHFFAEHLLINMDIDADDILHDIFLNIWCNKYRFINMKHIKNYIYQCIKNKHKDFIKKNIYKKDLKENIAVIDDAQVSSDIEIEVIDILSRAKGLLSQSCVDILMLYLDGYDVKEISDKLDKSQFTVYHQKTKAINTIKKYILKKNEIFSFLLSW